MPGTRGSAGALLRVNPAPAPKPKSLMLGQKPLGPLIAVRSTPVALREAVIYDWVLQPALHYELEQISKSEILRKLKQRFGGKTIRDLRFRVG